MLFAVHLSDGAVTLPWLVGGWVVAVGIVAVAGRRLRDDEVPRLGVLTAALFVASQAAFRVGPTSVHLLLNGLAGVILGRRVGYAVAVSLFLQALLAAHGGLTTLGLNVAVYGLPALGAGTAFGSLRRSGVLRQPAFRFLTVSGATGVWLLTAGVAVQWAWAKVSAGSFVFPTDPGEWWVTQPAVLVGICAAAATFGWMERRGEPEFALGLTLGAATGHVTVGLNAFVLTYGGQPGVPAVVGVVLLAHLPVVAVEALACGSAVAVLARAKPEWLPGGQPPAGSGNTSSNGTSH